MSAAANAVSVTMFDCILPIHYEQAPLIEPTTDPQPQPQPQPQQYKFARIILLVALVGVGFGFTVLFAILGPLGREVGLSELQRSVRSLPHRH